MLPQQIIGNAKQSNVFAQVFGSHNIELAKRLLTETLETEDDSEIKAEIEKRLKLLEPKQPVQVQCRICKNTFEPKNHGRFKQRICPTCIQKNNPTRF